ncbi:MAG: hypothetical protein E3K36_06400 [Candidatus Brocadia sp.]|nr:hypothetical protein [Candidatus Brocadia sp.]
MTQKKTTSDLLIELNEYSGEDKIITSRDMKALLAKQPKAVPVMSRLPQLDKHVGGFFYRVN